MLIAVRSDDFELVVAMLLIWGFDRIYTSLGDDTVSEVYWIVVKAKVWYASCGSLVISFEHDGTEQSVV
jgi:hypothetical protein